jgi:hypothetical protein
MVVAKFLPLLLVLAANVRVESFTPSINHNGPVGVNLPAAIAGAIHPWRHRNPNPPSLGTVGSASDGWPHPKSSRHLVNAGRSRNPRGWHRATFSRLHEAPPSKQQPIVDHHPRMGELTPPEATVYQLLHELHDGGFAFRVVVVGKGSIAEFTVPCLGPKLSIAQSPSSGANLLTLASGDASWEYHVQLSEVFKVALVEKQTPAKTLRIVRLVNATGDSISSLILVPDHPGHSKKEEEAIQWFHGLVEKYGSEIQL